MGNNVDVESMSRVSGQIPSSIRIDGEQQYKLDSLVTCNEDSGNARLAKHFYQFMCIFAIICLHSIALCLAYSAHATFLCWTFLWIDLPLCFMIWSLIGISMTLLLLKFVIGNVQPGTYKLNSWYYVHKLWFRQLIVSSFRYCFFVLDTSHPWFPLILRSLGAEIDLNNHDDIKIGYLHYFLHYPSNLLTIKNGLTTNARVVLVPFDLSCRGQYITVNRITFGEGVTCGNDCTIHQGSTISAHTMIGSITRITRETAAISSSNYNDNNILFGVPARQMPFVLPSWPEKDDRFIILKKSIFRIFFVHLIAKMSVLVSAKGTEKTVDPDG
ncbi:unnamed protein product [Didymodactylos carnosus]|nr:unnamed protein product [Didymodactylos carnosus]CAF4230873.1 unnamed protein product [Didymodactylos carnosus]